ncbi:hypothetical protein [Pontimicrobium sp. MEBiC01747]
MVLNNIEQLLEKYENGETSLKEEQQLKDYFSQETVAPHLEMYKPIFCYFLVNQQEQYTKHVSLKTKRVINYKWISVAAVTVLMAGFYFNRPVEDELGTYDNPEQAYEEITKSLNLVSQQFNKGTSKVNYLETLGQATKQVTYLDEMNNPMDRIFKNN